jgi:hypothetical protein
MHNLNGVRATCSFLKESGFLEREVTGRGLRPRREVPGTAPPKSRPVGYGLIRAGVRTNSMIGVTKLRVR